MMEQLFEIECINLKKNFVDDLHFPMGPIFLRFGLL